jgi:hypothetical protein
MVAHLRRLVRLHREAILRSLEEAADDQVLLCDCAEPQFCGC